MADRSFLSIGEVLTLLKDDFPDVTISKIRFLESQGLLDPERTPSGYRKFYDADVERLRWILQQQREHFLPLKVIKGRLGVEGEDDVVEGEAPEDVAEEGVARQHVLGRAPTAELVGGAEAPAPEPEAHVIPRPSPPPPPPAPPVAKPRPTPPPAPSRSAVDGDVSLTVEELAEAAGLSTSQLKELEKYGLMSGKTVAGSVYYDADALEVARVASGFFGFGVEARHLRMYKNVAEREVGFFEQVVMPLLKQRNPDSRRQAVETLHELTALGEALRSALLRVALRDHGA